MKKLRNRIRLEKEKKNITSYDSLVPFPEYKNDLMYDDSLKNVFNSLRCVRGNELSVPDYLNKSSIIIIDRTHELMWQNNYSENIAELEWQDSVDYCESLTLNTFSDWRLPTINELKTIIDYSENNPSINSLFSEISLEDYWSSTVVVGTSSNIWLVSFGAEGGKIYNQKSRSLKYIARCVRDN